MFFKILSILIICVSVLFAADKVTLEADRIRTLDNNTAVAEGNVIIIYKDFKITADKIIYNKAERNVEAIGNIKLIQNQINLNAEYAKINIDNQTGIIKIGSGFYPPYTYLKAENIEKINDNTLILKNAEVTSCKGIRPDWSVKAKDAIFEKGEYIQSKHSTFRIKDIPVLYSPYFIWPVKEKRESGFLIPEFGVSSSKGFFITPKYFWNIDVDKDMTFGVNYFDKIGPQFLNEFRFAKSRKENIYLYGEYIRHNDTESDKKDRWKFVNTSNIYLYDNVELRFDTNYVSDFRYDRDFEDYSMYKDSNQSDDDTKNEYINEIRLNYASKYVDVAVRYRDDMEYSDLEGGYKQTRVIRYPNLIVEKNNLDMKLVRINYKFDYNNIKEIKKIFYFESDTSKNEYKHQRLQAKLGIYKPINIKIGTLTPSYTQYATHWFDMDNYPKVDEKEFTNDLSYINETDDSVDRLIYHANVEFTLNEIYKNYKNFRHSIYNTYNFSYIPYLNQGNIPDLIEDDIIEEERLHTFKTINYFKADEWNAKLEITQKYDDTLHKDKFEPFYSKLKVSYKDYLDFLFNYKYDYYLKDSPYLKNNVKIKFKNFFMGYEFIYDKEIDDDENNNIKAYAGGKLMKIRFEVSETASRTAQNLSVSDFDKYKSKTFESKIVYDADCWSLGFKFKQKDYLNVTNTGNNRKIENIYYIYAELKGIGKTDREIYKN